MKTKIENLLQKKKQNKEKAFVSFITAGDPDLETTREAILTLEKNGVDIIELGVPFSEPMADGPTIQLANERALKNNISLNDILNFVKMMRKETQIPIILMGYYNPIFKMGVQKFVKKASACGVDGVLVVDLPPEESKELKTNLKNYPIDLIYLLTPTSDHKRIELVKQNASGFVYYVSLNGVTGSSHLNANAVKKSVQKIKKSVDIPVLVGFGISTPEHVKSMSNVSDGVIVGSVFVKIFEKNPIKSKAIKKLSAKVKELLRQ